MNDRNLIDNITEEDIMYIEKKYKINFTKKLKELYMNFNGKKIEPIEFFNKLYILDELYPLKYGECCEKVKDMFDDWLKKELFPIGDGCGVDFFWNTIDNKVYVIDTEFGETIENPICICNSIDDLILKIKFKE